MGHYPRTNGSGSGRPKNKRILNTERNLNDASVPANPKSDSTCKIILYKACK
jgi:hypothetical protein